MLPASTLTLQAEAAVEQRGLLQSDNIGIGRKPELPRHCTAAEDKSFPRALCMGSRAPRYPVIVCLFCSGHLCTQVCRSPVFLGTSKTLQGVRSRPCSSVQCEVGFRSLCFWYAGGSVPRGDRRATAGDQAER